MSALRISANHVQRRVLFHLLLAFSAAITLVGCVHRWPLPVPYAFDQPQTALTRHPYRFEAELPLPPCRVDKPSFVAHPNQCPDLEKLLKFVDQRASTMVQGSKTQNFALSDEMWALWQALSDRSLLAQTNFPVNIPNIGAIAKADRYVPMDSRDESPPPGRTPLAFSYAGFWWTFWDRGGPPDPEAPLGGAPFTDLIVFQNYPDNAAEHH
jgi:hypothetical protein